jgi:phosphopantothenoylcysteine decarboxylase / phosphopantothenate---cysteine ligase
MQLANKHIVLGVTGGIAAYKSADLVRRLREKGAIVRVVMTKNAQKFITPLTMQAVSGFPVHQDLFDLQAEAAMGHIELARWADVILVAPASADFVRRLREGAADDLLTTICLAAKSPIIIAPAMNQGMWNNIFTQHNIQILKEKDITIFGPQEGSQACGDVGFGRMMEPNEIVEKVINIFATGILSGVNVLITAGPTREAIDPVRYLTNGSSGKMGYALAEAAQEAGAAVTLVSGPVNLAAPARVEFISVVSAQQMFDAVMRKVNDCDIFLSVAAVSDYRPQTIAKQKLHKENSREELSLERTPDIAASVGQLSAKPFIVGFAAETENVLQNAQRKRQSKHMDIIIANQVGDNSGMNTDDNAVTLITDKDEIYFPLTAKTKLARELIKHIAKQFKERRA